MSILVSMIVNIIASITVTTMDEERNSDFWQPMPRG
jgi:hypothetical protein